MKFRDTFDIDVYMKSGNVVRLTRLLEFTLTSDKVKWKSTRLSNRLIDIRPEQIEAVVQVRAYKTFSWSN